MKRSQPATRKIAKMTNEEQSTVVDGLQYIIVDGKEHHNKRDKIIIKTIKFESI